MKPHLAGGALGAALLSLGAWAGCESLMSSGTPGGTGGAKPGAGAVTRQTHATFFPIQMGAHGNADCNSCHGGFATFKMFSCVGCHEHQQATADIQHAGITDYRFESTACLTCESCHKSFTAWGPGTPMDHLAVGGPAARCETCHLGNFTAAVAPFNHAVAKVAADTCNRCHTDVTTWMKFVHTPSNCYNGATGRTHEKATCVQCHAVPTNYTQTSCTACHRDRGKSCD